MILQQQFGYKVVFIEKKKEQEAIKEVTYFFYFISCGIKNVVFDKFQSLYQLEVIIDCSYYVVMRKWLVYVFMV